MAHMMCFLFHTMPQRRLFGLLTVLFLAFQSAATADFSGTVDWVAAVNRIGVKHDGIMEVVELFGVKAPQAPPELTARALAATKRLCLKKEVTVRVMGSIKYGEVWGQVTLPDQRRLDLILLSDGYVRWDRFAAPDDVLIRNREAGARKASKGLWAAEYREIEDSADEPSTLGVKALIHAVPGDAEQVYLVAFNRHFHRPRCVYLNQPGVSITKGEAIKKGYSPCPVCGRYRIPQTLKNRKWLPPSTLPHRDSVSMPLPIPRLEIAPSAPLPRVQTPD
ncbi:MAG TPA: thermonuclease family protein [Candidatus Hydrogenedentes bacterium]|nr:thermonuclease family protein [Candidatus Hydrogenedentota bacterium]